MKFEKGNNMKLTKSQETKLGYIFKFFESTHGEILIKKEDLSESGRLYLLITYKKSSSRRMVKSFSIGKRGKVKVLSHEAK